MAPLPLFSLQPGPRYFGSGWISGVLSIFLGGLGLGAVLCLLHPQWLTTPEFRAFYNMSWIRGPIQALLMAAFVMGFASVVLRRNKLLGTAGLLLTTLAVVLGGYPFRR